MTGSAKTSICTTPTMNSEITLPTTSVVGLRVVRIISVTRFSFSSSVEVSIWFPSSRITT